MTRPVIRNLSAKAAPVIRMASGTVDPALIETRTFAEDEISRVLWVSKVYFAPETRSFEIFARGFSDFPKGTFGDE